MKRTTPLLPRVLRLGAGGAVCVLLWGCRVGTDLPVAEPDELEAAEAAAIARTLILVTVENTVFSEGQTFFTHAHGPGGAHTHPVGGPYVHDSYVQPGPLPSSHNLFTIDLSEEVPCGAGGATLLEAAAEGEGNPLTQLGFVDYELGHDLLDCTVAVAESGEEIILSAPPYVTGEASVRYDGATLGEISGFLTGGVRWDGEAKAGECNLRLDFAATGPTVSEIAEIPVSGTFCDFEIDTAFSR